MNAPRATLWSPELNSGHPVQVFADPVASDANVRENILRVGGITHQLHTERYLVTWAKPAPGIAFYRLYGSISPFRSDNLLEDNITGLQASFYPPVFTDVLRYYFWVSAVDSTGKELYLSPEPVSLEITTQGTAFSPNPITSICEFPDADGLNCELRKVYGYIRKMDRFQLEQSGEVAYLYIRRHGEDKPWGIPCACNDSFEAESDPDYQGRGRCSLCFGTGVYAGFYPPIPIMIRYSNQPDSVYTYTKQGMTLSHAFNTYMVSDPVVNVDDLIVRAQDNSRYYVTKRKETSVRGIRLHQEFDLKQVEKKDILMEVSPTTIQAALDKAKVPGWARDRFKVFG